MPKLSPKIITLLAATAAAGASGAAISGAASSGTTGPAERPATPRPFGGPGFGGTALTGESRQKVEAAVAAKLPGATILRTSTDRGGGYESHVRKADGTLVEVRVATDFTVSAVRARPAGDCGPGGRRGPGRPGGPGGRRMGAGLASVAKALDVSEVKLRSALEAARPERPAGRPGPRGERRTAMYAAVARALGKDASAVQKAFEANRPAMMPTP